MDKTAGPMKDIRNDLGFVLRRARYDCTCSRCTTKHEFLFLFPENVTNEEIEAFVADRISGNKGDKYDVTREKCVRIRRNGNSYTYAEVVFKRPQSEGTYMAGGNYIHSSNASFIDMVGHNYPISVHDRFETWDVYEVLSR